MTETTDQTPEWMLRLENKKKRPHRLAHDIGAGSPCLSCGDACPGLDLHFWRKLCRNCKCKKEEHDVKDDEGYEQFEILLGPAAKKRKVGGVLKIKVPEEEQEGKLAMTEPGSKGVAFDWVPPNVSDDVAAEYMRQLPSGKLPISGSDGALYRRQQLEKQVPLHDLDASRCHNLSSEEIEALTKYLDNLKNNVVGQGCVTKVPVPYAESRLAVRGPHQLHGVSEVLGRPLASSQSADSIRVLPPIPPAYNSVPRPFQPNTGGPSAEDDDLPPPPLPNSLPPNVDLKTPSAFIPTWTLASSGTVPGEQWLPSSNPATLCNTLHSAQHGLIGQYSAASGRVLMKDGAVSQVQHSQSVPGQEARFTSALSSSGGTQGLLHDKGLPSGSEPVPGSVVYSSLAPGHQAHEPLYGSVPSDTAMAASLPQDGLTQSSVLPKGMVHGSAGVGQVAPQYSSSLKHKALTGSRHANSLPLPVADMSSLIGWNCAECKGVVTVDNLPQHIAHSSELAGYMEPNMASPIGQNCAHCNGIVTVDNLPKHMAHSFALHSYMGTSSPIGQNCAQCNGIITVDNLPKHIAHSSVLPGYMGPNMASPIGQNCAQCNGIITTDNLPKHIAHSSVIPGYMGPNMASPIGQNCRQCNGIVTVDNLPKHIAHSSVFPGYMGPNMASPIGQNCGQCNGIVTVDNLPKHIAHSSALPSHMGTSSPIGQNCAQCNGIVTEDNLSKHMAHLSALPGYVDYNIASPISSILQDRANHPTGIAYSSGVPGQGIPSLSASLGSHGGIPQDGSGTVQYGSVVPGSGMMAAAGTLPVDGVVTASLLPHGELVSSSTVATDALPKSAHMMSHPALGMDDLAGLMEQLSGSDGQESAAQAHLNCPECTQPIHAGEVAVFAERAGSEMAWHPQCFVCTSCKELLVDLMYFYHKGSVYCGRHFADLLSIPRCFACDELIFVKEYTVAEGQTFHIRHFCCFECDDPLAGKQYIPVEDQPVCLDCFDDKYGKKCHTCKQKITAGEQRVGWKELNWHVKGDCFRCFQCSKSLLGGRFVVKENQPFCSKECVQAKLAGH